MSLCKKVAMLAAGGAMIGTLSGCATPATLSDKIRDMPPERIMMERQRLERQKTDAAQDDYESNNDDFLSFSYYFKEYSTQSMIKALDRYMADNYPGYGR
ncbi:hypothetical protein H6503_04445 [Candidatus Woesearchaeota archaeon]|nr:hypothetical protein [Candidatus Woesearchaeota archaeon]